MKRVVGNNFFDLKMKYVWFSVIIGSVVGFFSGYGNHVLLFSLLTVPLAFFLLRYVVNLEKVFFCLFFMVIVVPKIPLISSGSRVAIRFEDILILYLWILIAIYVLRKGIRIRKNMIFFWIGLYLLSGLTSTTLGYFRGDVTTPLFFLRKIEYISLFFFAYVLLDKNNIIKFYKLVFISFAIVLFVGMIQYSGILNKLGVTELFVKYLQPMSRRFWVPHNSVCATFDGNYDLGGYFILMVPFFLLLYLDSNMKYKKSIFSAFFVSLVLLALSGSRGPIVAIFLIASFVLIKHLLFSTKRKMIRALLILTILLAIFVGGYKTFLGMFLKRTSNIVAILQGDASKADLKTLDESAYRRQQHWIKCYDGFVMHPLFGIGMGGFSEYFVTPDGQYIQALGETGLVGLLLFLFMLFYISRMNVKTAKYLDLDISTPNILHKLNRNFLIASSLGIFGLMLDGITMSIFDSSKVAMCLWSFVGVAAKLNSLYRNERLANSYQEG